MRVTYWKADTLTDSDVFSIRAKTKKECVSMREEYGSDYYGKPHKVTIEYAGAFELVAELRSEMSCDY